MSHDAFLPQVWVCWSRLAQSPRGSSTRCTSLSTSGTEQRECRSSLSLNFTHFLLRPRGTLRITWRLFGSYPTFFWGKKLINLTRLQHEYGSGFIQSSGRLIFPLSLIHQYQHVQKWAKCSFINGVWCFGYCCKCLLFSMCVSVSHLQATLWGQSDCTKPCGELRSIRYAAKSPCGPYIAPLCPARHTYTRLDPHTKDSDAPGGMGGQTA